MNGVEIASGPEVKETQDIDSSINRIVGQFRSWRTAGILVPFLILFVLLSAFSGPFLTSSNLLNILDQQSSVLIIACAGTLVLIGGGLDLSVGATYGFSGVVTGQVLLHHSMVLAVIAGLVVGLIVGLINGIVTTYFRINSLIATLATSFAVGGIAARVTNGNLIVLSSKPGFAKIATSELLGVRSSIWIAVICILLLGLVLSRTVMGRYLYAAGGNAQAARLAGVNVNLVRIGAFVGSGLAASIGGIIDVSRVLSAQSANGEQLAFTVLAGIVVGGTSILGGQGAIWRSVIGVLFIALVGNGFDLIGINPLYEQIILGVILLIAVGMDAWSGSWRRS